MNWLTNFVKPKLKSIKSKMTKSESLWIKCKSCEQMIFHRELKEKKFVCPNCDYHMPMPTEDRLESIYDNAKYKEIPIPEVREDPLKFKDKIKYIERLKKEREKVKRKDAILIALGSVNNIELVTAIMDFNFMGGSMGLQVGEGIVKATKVAAEKKCPLLIVSASGGARMQEGILSLMQMPKTVAAIEIFKERKLAYFCLFTNPTFGGVSASFTMLGDVLMAEPGALIGFAGPRVIKKTIKKELPDGFQKSEYLHEHGALDLIIHRKYFKDKFSTLLKHLHK
tara:strand:- start:1050 stop:1895 length:846 start_codon:yes stop_codon:yes gene_type:complete